MDEYDLYFFYRFHRPAFFYRPYAGPVDQIREQRPRGVADNFLVVQSWGALLMILYGMLRRDIVIIAGQIVLYYIYLRNLMLKGVWNRTLNISIMALILLPFLMSAGLYFGGVVGIAPILKNDAISQPVLVWGTVSTAFFSLRFFYQWILSEKSDDSIFPMGFWLISIVGSWMIIVYGILRADPVIIVGQLFGNVTYTRNIILLKRAGRSQNVAASGI